MRAEHLTTLDASFLEAEDSDRHVSLAIGGVSVMEGPLPNLDDFAAGFAERIVALPRFRQVLRTHLFDLQPPEWVEVDDLDVAHHIHRAALPHPGDEQALYRFIADVMERRLDRDRPLWECWIIEGLADDKWALLMKIHHCIADGIATMHMISALSDGGEGETFASRIRAANAAHQPATSPKLTLNPLSWAGAAWHLAANATGTAALAVEGAAEILGGVVNPAPKSSLTGPVTAMRRYSAARVSLQDVNEISNAFAVTLNDVALAALTDSFRAALIRRGQRPQRNSLRTLVPVSVRANEEAGITDNRVSAMLPFLPVDEADPVDQLRAVHRRLERAKASGQREAGSIFVAATNVLPFPLTAWAVRALTRRPQRGVVTLATNVPGPRRRQRVMDREVSHVLPVPPIALGIRTGVAIVSYADELAFGVTADYDATPDVNELARGIEAGVARLLARSRIQQANGET
ncbi:WS/DGAT/MGAT family O-acyltransferase [Mycobacterium sp. IDR2000157661]|uniref:WS/DGAT/MGAT family O-acyltransferase n=1 Tax=Mycobacterium sp. IDR2000157661 TaxID=2867005 RepID=UPI001EEA233B|nr:wax ester/triacylglycerol synthase family O-acyltransferase [Mycobacterium sp. IDR2000157661]ULE33421.1 wax ester/triacylglycerol synthase family O-acyltransferase [Mycobacterium sp. IDR2000157661]